MLTDTHSSDLIIKMLWFGGKKWWVTDHSHWFEISEISWLNGIGSFFVCTIFFYPFLGMGKTVDVHARETERSIPHQNIIETYSDGSCIRPQKQ